MSIHFLKVSYQIILYIFSFVLLVLSSCNNEDFLPDESGMFDLSKAATFQLGDTILLVSDKVASIENGKVGIGLVEIIDDSKCPTDEQILCVWEGQVSFQIDILIVGDSKIYSHIISTSDSLTHQVAIGDYQVQYVSISSEKSNLEPIDFDDYEVRLIVINN